MRKISIFFFVIAMILPGMQAVAEYNAATKTEDMILIGTEHEVGIGKSVSKQIEKEFGLEQDERLIRRVEAIGERLVPVIDRKDVVFYFKVLKSDKVNAVSLPGGYVYVFRGLIEKLDNDNELAGVIGHELGHIVCKHAIKRMQTGLGYMALRILSATQGQDRGFNQAADVAFGSVLMAYSREDEFMADKLGVEYAKRAGYDPMGTIQFLEKLKKVQQEEPLREYSYWRTHPYLDDRIRQARLLITGNITFDDYINEAKDRA